MDDPAFDEMQFPPLSQLVGSWMEGVGETAREGEDALWVDEIAVDIPFEMRLSEGASEGSLRVLGSPPTQRTETSVLPVWHRLSVRYVLEEG